MIIQNSCTVVANTKATLLRVAGHLSTIARLTHNVGICKIKDRKGSCR